MKTTDLLASSDAPPEAADLSNGHRNVIEQKHRLKDGTVIEVEIHSDTLEWDGKKRVVALVHDITHRKQTERELIQAQEAAVETSRLKSEFLANVSHEVRTPLNGIIGVVRFLSGTPMSDEQKEYVGIIRKSGEALLGIVNDVLDFSKTEAGEAKPDIRDFDVRSMVQQSVEMTAWKAKKPGLRLTVDVAQDIPPILNGCPSWLERVLVNLVNNAVKFTEQGEVSVRVSREGQNGDNEIGLRFAVQDTGIGIPAQARDRLFRAFSQADGSLTRKYGGTGLGLAICKQLIELMSGHIGYDSTVGQGSTFWFSVPLKQASNGPARAVKDAGGPTKPKPESSARILLVEDDPVNQFVMKRLLRELGYKPPVVVEDGQQAVDNLEKESYDVILMDCQMPVMDGYEATRIIREKEKTRNQRTPIIAVTAHVMEGDQEKCLNAGMDDYVPKPVEVADLDAALDKWLGKQKGFPSRNLLG